MATRQQRGHPDTGTLLAVLDGEAGELDAAHAERCAQCAQELARLRMQRTALAQLEPIEPGEHHWQRLRHTLARRRTRRRWLLPAVGLAAAAALTAVMVIPLHQQRGAVAADSTARLIAQSQALEDMLRLVNGPHAGDPRSAATISAAEDRLAHIDQTLSYASAAGADPDVTRDLWRQRVRLMAGLVQVRAGSARSASYEY